MRIKQELYNHCTAYIEQCYQNISDRIESNQSALNSETKSSAGDKHETGRAMLQLEIEKASQQLSAIQNMRETLAKISLDKKEAIGLGSLVETSLGTYFLSVAAGSILINQARYFAISTASPIGKLLLGKQRGEQIEWSGKYLKILKIE